MIDDAFVANVSRGRIALLLLGAIAFIAIGIFMVRGANRDPESALIGWASILFFGLCGVVIAGQLFRSGVDIQIDARGILWRRWSDETIPWAAITSLYPDSAGRQPFLCLTLFDPDAYRSTHIMGKFASINRYMQFGDISITIMGTDRSFGELLAAVERFAPRQLLEPPPARPVL